MKNHYLAILFLFTFSLSFAQTKDSLSVKEQQRREANIQAGNPFKRFGYKPKIHTLSKGKYLEFHDLDSIVKIGSFSYHVKQKAISGFTKQKEAYSEATLRPEIISRWFSVDPLAEEFPEWSPYNFVKNNPIIYIDPDGRAPVDIIGQTKKDAEKIHTDLNTMFADSKFDQFRGLLTRGKRDNKKQFDKIDSNALTSSLDGANLSTDEQALVDIVVGAINSDKDFVVEYADASGTVSSDGANAVVGHLNNTQSGVGDMMRTKDGNINASVIQGLGGSGFNVPTKNGSHSFILEGTGVSYGTGNRTVTAGHEVFGHGIPSARGLTPAQNNANAIRTDNLVRRVLGIPQRDGSTHGGFKEGQITEPYKIPIRN